jgi:ABC-2 type transport system ATP-binding protein
VRGVLGEVRSRGISVLLSSHLLGEVELVCDRVAILVDGKIVEQGTPAQLTRPRGIEVETASGVRAFADAAREDAPKIVADLVAAGERIYGVRTLASTLEDAYLEAVEAPRS